MEQNNTTNKDFLMSQSAWDKLPLSQKAEMIKVAVKNGIYNLADIKQKYEELIAEQSDPGMTGMMKSKLATSAHYGNPTARRMTNYDGRSYTFPNEWDEVEPGIYEPKQGNVYVSSYDNLVTPQIQDNGKSLEFVEDVWSPENDPRSYAQSLKFNNAKDAQYFGEHYKEIAPMMKLYAKGGKKKTTASGKQAFLSTLDQSLQEDGRFNTPEWRRYFTELANVESGYSPNITNSIGAKGYFQLMPSNRSKNWTTPTQQFHEFYKLAGNNLDYLNKHLTKKDWERAKALGIDIFGLMAGAHLGGVGGVVRALRGQGNAKDSNGTSVMNYMTRFSQSGKGSPYLGSNFSSVPVVRDVSPISTFTPEQYNLIYGDSFADNSQLFPFETPTITPYVAPDYTNLFNGISTPTIDKSVAEAYSKEQLAKEERANRLNALNLVLGNGLFGNPSDSSSNGLFDFALGDVASNPLMLVSSIYSDNNTFAGGGDMFSLDTLPGFKDFKINKDLYNTELLQYLRFKEGFLDHPKNIGDGVITIGAGLTNPKYIKQYHSLGDTWTEEANKAGMVEEIAARKARLANTLPNWQKLPPASQDALTAYDYNVGISKSNHPSLWDAAAAQNWYEVANQMNATSKNPKFIKGLKQRRAEEQAWFKRGLEERNKKIAVPSSTNILSQALNYYNNAGKNLLKSAYKAARRSLGLGKFKFFDEGGPTEEDDINLFRRNGNYFYQASPDSEEITVTPVNTLFDDPALWTYTDNNGRLYTPRKATPYTQGTITEKEDEGPLVEAAKNYLGELQYDINNGIPIGGKYTMPAIAASALLPLAGEYIAGTSIAGIPTTTLMNNAIGLGFAGHGLNHLFNEGINGYGDAAMTALEIAPLGSLAKPIYEGVIQPGMRLFNSPLTGNWTRIGNREYRLSPNSLGASGIPIESRGIASQITAENAASMTPEQWDAAYKAAYERGDKAEGQRLWDLWFKHKAPNSKAVDEDGFPLPLFHGTRTAEGIRKNGFSKAMSGKGNRGADDGNTYLTNSYENAEYTGVKAHEIEPLIDKVNSVYDLFDSETIPSIKQIYSQVDDLSRQSSEINKQLYKLRTGTLWDRISTRLGLNSSPSNRAKKLQSIIDSNGKKIDELDRRARIVDFLDNGLSFIGGNSDRAAVNTLNFIKEPVNPASPYRQIAADRVINAMYGTADQIYSPKVLKLYGNFESPLLSDFKMSPTDINPLKTGRFSSNLIDYNNREKALLQELASPQYDSSISKNKFDILFGDVYITKNPNNLKLSEPFTLADDGSLIPLTKRADFSNPDIRYGLIPFLGLGAAGTLYGTSDR